MTAGWDSLSNDNVANGDAFNGVADDKIDNFNGINALFALCQWKMVKQNYVREILRCVNERKQTWLIRCQAYIWRPCSPSWLTSAIAIISSYFFCVAASTQPFQQRPLGWTILFFFSFSFVILKRIFGSSNKRSANIPIRKRSRKRKTERKLNVIKDIDRFHGSWSDARIECCIRLNRKSFHFVARVHTVALRAWVPSSRVGFCRWPMTTFRNQCISPEVGKRKGKETKEKDWEMDFVALPSSSIRSRWLRRRRK